MKKYLIVLSVAILAVTSVAHAQSYTFSSNLTLGSSGSDVVALQTWLLANGYSIPALSSGIAVKGYFGEQTRAAVASYQRLVGLPSFGFFGPLTRAIINGVNTPVPLSIVSPNGGENWQIGSTQKIIWTAPAFIRATYVDIELAPYYPPCTSQICPMTAQSAMYPYRMPYKIASSISIDNHSYDWRVGSFIDPTANISNSPISTTIPDGQYTIQICETGTSVCDSSNSPFTIYSTSANKPPVISGLDAPTTLGVKQTGTWTIHATDPEGGQLSYSVTWGDEANVYPVSSSGMIAPQFVQNTTFTHIYANAGLYTVTFTVTDNAGLSTQTKTTVSVN